MDARLYFHLSDSIASAQSADDIAAMRDLLGATEMHALERQALERGLRARAAALQVGDIVAPRPPAARAD